VGDRIAFGFKAEKNEPTIWLYAHWSGSERFALVAEAVSKAKPRWNDASYATRIAISTIVGDAWNEETGFGISVGESSGLDLNYDEVLVVHWYNRTITHQDARSGKVHVDWGFEAYLSATPLTRV
jgi:hypothetical protein